MPGRRFGRSRRRCRSGRCRAACSAPAERVRPSCRDRSAPRSACPARRTDRRDVLRRPARWGDAWTRARPPPLAFRARVGVHGRRHRRSRQSGRIDPVERTPLTRPGVAPVHGLQAGRPGRQRGFRGAIAGAFSGPTGSVRHREGGKDQGSGARDQRQSGRKALKPRTRSRREGSRSRAAGGNRPRAPPRSYPVPGCASMAAPGLSASIGPPDRAFCNRRDATRRDAESTVSLATGLMLSADGLLLPMTIVKTVETDRDGREGP